MTPRGERPLVLIVDDYADSREMYAVYLSCVGFDVIEAGNGVEALQRAADSAPDVIVMDLSLPVMDGWETTRRLRADVRTTGIPVIVLTGHVLTGTPQDAKNIGCDAFVSKPCLPDALEREIRRVLDQPAGPPGAHWANQL
jgi:two-component system cell cycle response regulator DivK